MGKRLVILVLNFFQKNMLFILWLIFLLALKYVLNFNDPYSYFFIIGFAILSLYIIMKQILIIVRNLMIITNTQAKTVPPDNEPDDSTILITPNSPTLTDTDTDSLHTEIDNIEIPSIGDKPLPSIEPVSPPAIEKKSDVVNPTSFEDLLTPEIQERVELKELKKRNKLERLTAKEQELYHVRQERLILRGEKLNARHEKVALKRTAIEEQLTDTTLLPDKRQVLESKLDKILSREIQIGKKLERLEKRSERLETKYARREGVLGE